MDYCAPCRHEYDGTGCYCRDDTGMAPDRRPHPDPHIEMGRTLLDAEAMTTPAEAIAHGATVKATARAIARTWCRRYRVEGARELADAMFAEIGAFDRESRDMAQDARRAGL